MRTLEGIILFSTHRNNIQDMILNNVMDFFITDSNRLWSNSSSLIQREKSGRATPLGSQTKSWTSFFPSFLFSEALLWWSAFQKISIVAPIRLSDEGIWLNGLHLDFLWKNLLSLWLNSSACQNRSSAFTFSTPIEHNTRLIRISWQVRIRPAFDRSQRSG